MSRNTGSLNTTVVKRLLLAAVIAGRVWHGAAHGNCILSSASSVQPSSSRDVETCVQRTFYSPKYPNKCVPEQYKLENPFYGQMSRVLATETASRQATYCPWVNIIDDEQLSFELTDKMLLFYNAADTFSIGGFYDGAGGLDWYEHYEYYSFGKHLSTWNPKRSETRKSNLINVSGDLTRSNNPVCCDHFQICRET